MYGSTSYFDEMRHFATLFFTISLVNAHLTGSNKGELANQNAAYKIITLE